MKYSWCKRLFSIGRPSLINFQCRFTVEDAERIPGEHFRPSREDFQQPIAMTAAIHPLRGLPP